MPSDLIAERIRVVTGSMEYTISAVNVVDPNGVVTEPSGSIIRAQDGSFWVNTTGGTVWVNTGPSGLAALSGTINSGIVALSGTINSGIAALSGTVNARVIDLTGSLISSVAETNTSLRAGVTASINSIYTTILAGTSASDAAAQVSLKAGVTASLAAQYTMMIAGTTASDNTFYTTILAGTTASDTAVQTSLKAGVTASFARWPSDLSVAGSITGSGNAWLQQNVAVGDDVGAHNVTVRAGSSWADVRLWSGPGNGGSLLWSSNSGSTNAGEIFYYHPGNYLDFKTSATSRMVLDASKLQVKTSAEVTGTIWASADARIAGSVIINGGLTGSAAKLAGNVSIGAGVGSSHTLQGSMSVNGSTGLFGDVLTNVAGTPRWATPGAAFASGSGLTNKVVKWGVAAVTQSITDSSITDDGFSVEIAPRGGFRAGGASQMKLSIPGAVASCSFMDTDNQHVNINAGYLTGSVNIGTFPGATGQIYVGSDTNITWNQGAMKVFGALTGVLDVEIDRNAKVKGAFSGSSYAVTTYDGAGNLLNSAIGRLWLGTQTFTTGVGGHTYTPTRGTRAARLRMVGGGGGSSGVAGAASSLDVSGGGASGAYLEWWLDPRNSELTGGALVIGAGGTGGTSGGGAAGGGGNTAITIGGTTFTATGGGGGNRSGTGSTNRQASGGDYTAGSGADATGTFTSLVPVALSETPGGYGIRFSLSFCIGGIGGSNPLGAGGRGTESGNSSGEQGRGYGGGGGGSMSSNLDISGMSGSAGIIIIEEYA